ncbi:MAG TPA: 2-phosphosulfolactate phosphatase [Methanobacteriaceae archaeon]|nr:2-phosphosulfolactate phosphatase [Methanobacteriaceae archaeon]HNS25257.1 2-phosphosulfolactate phosphatase [Methanobacteriaceae archaeon]
MDVSLTLENSYSEDVCIMVDVLRASTTITVALEKFSEVIPVTELEEALNLASQKEVVVAGERGGATVKGFDTGNSPVEIQRFCGETLILTTSNGTRILGSMKGTPLIGSFINAESVALKALELAQDHIEVVMAGVNGRFAIEDFLGAGIIISHLQRSCTLDEMALASVLACQDIGKVEKSIYKSLSAANLCELGFKKDVEFCLQQDISELVPVYQDGIIRSQM